MLIKRNLGFIYNNHFLGLNKKPNHKILVVDENELDVLYPQKPFRIFALHAQSQYYSGRDKKKYGKNAFFHFYVSVG